MLLDSGTLTEVDGRFRLVGDLGDLAVPDSLTALLGARLDALDPETRDVVGTCSVLGISFTAAAVAEVAGRTQAAVQAVLDGLVRRELFAYDDDPMSPERGQHRFLQGVLREVAYGRLSRKERQARHLAAAGILGAEGADELAGVVATHYLEAVRFASDEDREALQAQGRRRRSRARPRAPGPSGPMPALPDTSARPPSSRPARASRSACAMHASPISCSRATRSPPGPRGPSCLRSAAGTAIRGLQARAAFHLADALLNQGRPLEAVQVLAEVRVALGAFVTEDPDGVRLLAELGRCHLMAAQPDDAARIIDEALVVAERMNLREVIAELLASKGWALGSAGRPLEAAALLRGAVVFAERDGAFRAEFRARMNFSAWGDDGVEAYECARIGFERARQHGYDVWVNPLLGNAAGAALEIGDWDWLRSAMAEARVEEGVGIWRFQALAPLVIALGLEGDDVAASRIEAQFTDAVAGLDDMQARSGLYSMRARLAFARGDLEEAARQTDLQAEAETALLMFDSTWHITVGLVRREPARLLLAISDQFGGRVSVAVASIATAGMAALDGDGSALPAMDDALGRLAATGFRLSTALIRRSRVLLSPG